MSVSQQVVNIEINLQRGGFVSLEGILLEDVECLVGAGIFVATSAERGVAITTDISVGDLIAGFRLNTASSSEQFESLRLNDSYCWYLIFLFLFYICYCPL